MKKVLLKNKNEWSLVKSLKPFRETSVTKEAMVFNYAEAEKTLYLYGLENDFEIYEL